MQRDADVQAAVVESLYNVSDDQTGFQVRDRQSFQRVLGLSPENTVPNAKTWWLFVEQLARDGLIEKLFGCFGEQLWQSGLMPLGGQISDASLGQRAEEPQRAGREQADLRKARRRCVGTGSPT